MVFLKAIALPDTKCHKVWLTLQKIHWGAKEKSSVCSYVQNATKCDLLSDSLSDEHFQQGSWSSSSRWNNMYAIATDDFWITSYDSHICTSRMKREWNKGWWYSIMMKPIGKMWLVMARVCVVYRVPWLQWWSDGMEIRRLGINSSAERWVSLLSLSSLQLMSMQVARFQSWTKPLLLK